MSYKRKNFGILGGEAKGGASIRLYSYLLDKEETFSDLLATGYFNEERERLLPNDLIKVLMPDKDFKLGYLMVARVTLDNVEVIKVEIDAKSDLLPLPDSDNGSAGTSDLISRYDHQHPKVIATETIRGQIIIASEEETLQGIDNTKAITPLRNKLYFDNQQATNEEINNGANVKKYLNPLQVKTIKDELQENINNNTTLINANKQELDEDISSINQDIVDVNSQIQGINTNKANVSLDNINAEGQNVIKGIITNNTVLIDGSNAGFGNLSAGAKENIQNCLIPDLNNPITVSNGMTIEHNGILYFRTGALGECKIYINGVIVYHVNVASGSTADGGSLLLFKGDVLTCNNLDLSTTKFYYFK